MSVFTHTVHAHNEELGETRTQDQTYDTTAEAREAAELFAQEQGPDWVPLIRVLKKTGE